MKEKVDYLDSYAASMPGGIGVELQETVGQQNFIESHTLPIDGLEWRGMRGDRYEMSPKQYLESQGFEFLEPDDDMFINVNFPEGWKIEATDHSMWTELVDDKGNKRAGIFYKAAFYDCSAHIDLVRRYSAGQAFEHHESYVEGAVTFYVADKDEIIFTTNSYEYTKQYEDDYWEVSKHAQADVDAYLAENYPDHDNPMAYWD